MTILNLLKTNNLQNLKINKKFLEKELIFTESDKKAAWDLYIELITRIATQPLEGYDGVEETALESIHVIFPITRQIIKDNGKECFMFSVIAVIMLNQVIRPFTAKWHRLSTLGALKKKPNDQEHKYREFRKELKTLQQTLSKFSLLFSHIAGVEDITHL